MMEKCARKRPRKAKLVPRKLVELDEDVIVTDLQTIPSTLSPCESVPIYNMNSDVNNKASPRKFDVTVAVEEFHCDSVNISNIQGNTLASEDTDRLQIDDKGLEYYEHILNRNNILEATNHILENSTNIADKFLSIEVKNCLGNVLKYNADIQEPSSINIKLQTVFQQWDDWQKSIELKYRSSPLFYKCYICEKSWWYLYDFQEHLKEHDNFELELEEYKLHEANVIAYFNLEDIVEIKHFNTEGECPKCGEIFDVHKTNYNCTAPYCNKEFPTCFTLAEHKCTCYTMRDEDSNMILSPSICEICCFICHTQDDFQDHMYLKHSVRSDVIMPFEHNQCSHCKSSYACRLSHICTKNAIAEDNCVYCFRTVPPTRMHFDKNEECICIICNEILPKQCMKAEHLMTHTEEFIIVQSCMLCDDFKFFLDDSMAKSHEKNEHVYWKNEERLRTCIYSIIIPQSCVVASCVRKTMCFVPEASTQVQPSEEIISEPEIKIKEEIDDCEFDTGYDQPDMDIKKEFECEDNPVIPQNYAVTTQDNPTNDNPGFSIKVEHIKQEEEEMQESEYEDDIIRLDYCYPSSMQDSQQVFQDSMQDTLQKCVQMISQNSKQMTQIISKQTSMTNKKAGNKIKLPKLYKCHKCNFEGRHREYRQHVAYNCEHFVFKNGIFPCSICGQPFDKFEKYTSHFTVHGFQETSCPVCFATLQEVFDLLPHMSKHIEKLYKRIRVQTVSERIHAYCYKCKFCLNDVGTTDFFVHWEEHFEQGELKEVEREVTESEASNDNFMGTTLDEDMLQAMLKHLQTPTTAWRGRDNKPGCMICQRRFERSNEYKRHLIEHLLMNARLKKPSFLKCQICYKGFHHDSLYKKHMRDHGSLPIYECEFCDKTFSDSSNFTKHKKLHNENAYTCDICGRKFQAKLSIEKHVKIHEKQDPIKCTKCDRIFHFESALKKHFRFAHDKTNCFRCKVCLQKFSSLKTKWDHMWLVHKERKHQADCRLCNKSYRKYSDLKRHMRNEHDTENITGSKSRRSKSKKVTPKKVIGAEIQETLVIYD